MTDFLFDTEPIIAWRGFRWADRHEEDMRSLFLSASRAPEGVNPFEWALRPRLMGLGYTYGWPEKTPMEAYCGNGHRHVAPQKECSCGVWGLKSRETALKTVIEAYEVNVLGKVAMWGKFVEHEIGWRAQYAYPLELEIVVGPWQKKQPIHDQWAVDLADLYGVPAQVTVIEPPPEAEAERIFFSSTRPWPKGIVHPTSFWSTVLTTTLANTSPPTIWRSDTTGLYVAGELDDENPF